MTKALINTYWLEKLALYSKIYVGFSGGLDSTVLLHALLQQPLLKNKIYAIHVNHGLSKNANLWQLHCQDFCNQNSIKLFISTVSIQSLNNIEQQARIARYNEFVKVMETNDCLALAHHQNDQAETILLQILRGSGINGLAGIAQSKKLGNGMLIRPFLQHDRNTLEHYANKHNLTWVDDESNFNESFSRNYLRHKVMPLIQNKWPGFTKNFSTTAQNCQQAKLNLLDLAYIDCPELKDKNNYLSLNVLKNLKKARLTNVLKVWLENNSLQVPAAKALEILINDFILSKHDKQPVYKIHDKYIRRFNGNLYIVDQNNYAFKNKIWEKFPHPLEIGNNYFLKVDKGAGLDVAHDSLVEVRFRSHGEKIYWKKQTQELKKILQSFKIPTWKRDQIPLIYINNHLAQIGDFVISDKFYSNNGYKIQWYKGEVLCPSH